MIFIYRPASAGLAQDSFCLYDSKGRRIALIDFVLADGVLEIKNMLTESAFRRKGLMSYCFQGLLSFLGFTGRVITNSATRCGRGFLASYSFRFVPDALVWERTITAGMLSTFNIFKD